MFVALNSQPAVLYRYYTGTPDPLLVAALQKARLLWGCCVVLVLLVSPRHLPRWPKLRSGIGLRLTSSLEVEATPLAIFSTVRVPS